MNVHNRKTGHNVRLLSVASVRVYDPATGRTNVVAVEALGPVGDGGKSEVFEAIAMLASDELKFIRDMTGPAKPAEGGDAEPKE